MPLFLLAARPFPRRWPTWLAPIAAVEYLEAAPAFARNHGPGMPIAQLDLTNRPAGCVDLPENYRRAGRLASRRSARRRVAASPDLNSCRRGIEVRLEHRLISITLARPMPTTPRRIGEKPGLENPLFSVILNGFKSRRGRQFPGLQIRCC